MRNIFKKIVLALASILITILFLEAAIRIWPDDRQETTVKIEDPLIGSRYQPNLDISIHSKDKRSEVRFITNDLGFVGKDPAVTKEDYRIAHLGDSFTAGLDVPYEKNYVSLIDNELFKEGFKTEGLNFGVGGFGTEDAQKTFTHYASKTNPDAVLLWVYLGNDLADNEFVAISTSTALTPASENKKKDFTFARLLKKSALFQFTRNSIAHSAYRSFITDALSTFPVLESFLFSATLADLPDELRIGFTPDPSGDEAILRSNEFIHNLEEDVSKTNAFFGIVLVPAHFQVDTKARERLLRQYPELKERGFDSERPNHIFKAAAERSGVPLLDLSQAFRSQCKDTCALYVCRYCHLSEAGHAFVAENIATWLYKVAPHP